MKNVVTPEKIAKCAVQLSKEVGGSRNLLGVYRDHYFVSRALLATVAALEQIALQGQQEYPTTRKSSLASEALASIRGEVKPELPARSLIVLPP